MAKAPETTVPTVARGKQLQATVPGDVYDAFNDYHWAAKKEVVDLVREALIEFGVKNGFLTVDEDGKASPAAKA